MPRTKSGIQYTVRENTRAKRVIIKVRVSSDVEVVVPRSFDRSQLREILERRSVWIAQQRKRFRDLRRIYTPKTIELAAIGERWDIKYEKEPSDKTWASEAPGWTLIVRGRVDDPALVSAALNAWLHRKAKLVLKDWLSALSHERSIAFNRLTIRRQKTRWGSCSNRKNINLNRNLLFLPARLVEYVLIHELCHIDQQNHSKAFWDLLERHVKGCWEIASEMKQAGRKVPEWANLS